MLRQHNHLFGCFFPVCACSHRLSGVRSASRGVRRMLIFVCVRVGTPGLCADASALWTDGFDHNLPVASMQARVLRVGWLGV
jgi:hypothetical protein